MNGGNCMNYINESVALYSFSPYEGHLTCRHIKGCSLFLDYECPDLPSLHSFVVGKKKERMSLIWYYMVQVAAGYACGLQKQIQLMLV